MCRSAHGFLANFDVGHRARPASDACAAPSHSVGKIGLILVSCRPAHSAQTSPVPGHSQRPRTAPVSLRFKKDKMGSNPTDQKIQPPFQNPEGPNRLCIKPGDRRPLHRTIEKPDEHRRKSVHRAMPARTIFMSSELGKGCQANATQSLRRSWVAPVTKGFRPPAPAHRRPAG